MLIKFIRKITYFFQYRKILLENEQFLAQKYGLNIDLFLRFWTVLDFNDAPEEIIKQYGKGILEIEYKKYIQSLNTDLSKLGLLDLVSEYHLKNLPPNRLGITFGYSGFNTKRTLLNISLICLLTIIGIIGLLLI